MLEIMTFGILRVIRSIVDSISSTTASGSTHTDCSNESLAHSNLNDHDWVQVYHADCLLGVAQCNDQILTSTLN